MPATTPLDPSSQTAHRRPLETSLHAAHRRQLQRYETGFRAQHEAYRQALLAAGFQAHGVQTLERGAGFEWVCEAVLVDPTSGQHLVLQASLLSSKTGPRTPLHVFRHLLAVRSPDGKGADIPVMEFVMGQFDALENEADVRALLEEGAENTPASLMQFFADRALGR